nr:2A [Cosavirus D]
TIIARPYIRESSNVSRLKLLLSGDIETNPG